MRSTCSGAILGQGFFGSNLSAFATNGLTRRVSNSVNYRTPSLGGLKASMSKLDTGAKGNSLAVAYSYPLSKRTNLYASYAALRNNSAGRFGLNSSSTSITPAATAAGSDPSVLAFGMRHTF